MSLGACVAWRLRRLPPVALGACGAWRLWRLPLVMLGACGTVPFLAPFSFKLASTGLQRPKSAQITDFGMFPDGYYHNLSLLGLLDASNLLQCTIHNFVPYYYLFGLASRGLQRPKSAQITVSGLSLERDYRD